jgi:vitamin B12 transporter
MQYDGVLRRRAAMLMGLFALGALPRGAGAQQGAQLDTVTAIASRTRLGEASRDVEVITRANIANSTARTIADVLAERMSVDINPRSEAQADLSIRGTTPEQTLVLVDGVRVNDVQSAHYNLDLAVPLASVERIEILRGAASAVYGPDAVGGVINIVTRHDTAPPKASVRGGAFGTFGGSADGGAALGPATVTSSADFEKSDGFRPGTDYRDGQGRVGLTSRAGPGQLQADVGAGIRDFGANDFYGPYNSRERTGATTADARWDAPSGAWTVSTDASTRYHTDRFTLVRDDPALYQNVHAAWQSTGEVVGRREIGPADLALGVDGMNAQLVSNSLGGRAEWREAVFAEASAGVAQFATLDAGLRGDRSSIYGSFLSPSLAASVQITRDVRLRVSGARGFRAPTWTERYYVDPANQGNPNLKPEQFWTGDIGATVSLPRSTSLDVAGYVRRAENLIDWVKPADAGDTAVWNAANVGVATYRGVEATLTLPRLRGMEYALTASGLTFDDAQGAGLIGKYALQPITGQFGLRASLPERHGLRASLELMAARRATEGGYLTGNAHLDWSRGSLRLTLNLRNLTNAEWLDASSEPVAGRGLYVGASWSAR